MGDIDKAVNHLVSNAKPKSSNWCAKYVANALEAGGFKFTRQSSAYLYRTNGVLTNIGYREIPKPSSFVKGDITVTDKNRYHVDGHIAMWSGSQWISDYFQKSEYVYANNQPPIYYYRYGSAPSPSPTPTTALEFKYAVRTTKGGILPEVTNTQDYAGLRGYAITDIAIKVNKGSIKYRVHVKGENWLDYVYGYNWNDANGYAGNHKPIDLVEIIYSENSELPKYRVSPVNADYYSWQYGNKTGTGFDGYAGAIGKTIDRIQISP